MIKKFFRIEKPFKLEYNDIRALITIMNVILIIAFGRSFAWFSLITSIIGLIKDYKTDRRINGFLMHGANTILYIYLLSVV